MPPHSLYCKNCKVSGHWYFEVISVSKSGRSAKVKCKECGKIKYTSGRYAMNTVRYIIKLNEGKKKHEEP